MDTSSASTPAVRPRRRLSRTKLSLLGAGALACALPLVAAGGSVEGHGWDGVAVLRDASGAQVGKVRFDGNRHDTVVKVTIDGVAVGLDAFHGLHIHANDSAASCDPAAASGPFTNVGGHWNPSAAVHGAHAGDLPSILVLADGSGSARSVTGRFDPGEVVGRAVILHAAPDNFANIPSRYVTGAPPVAGADAATAGTGDAGGRIACGIIEVK